MTDSELISIILADKDSKEGRLASTQLFKRYYNKFDWFIIKRNLSVTRMMKRKDVKLIALAKMFANLDGFDDSKCSFSTWAFTIVENTLVDQCRQRLSLKNQFLAFDADFAQLGLTQEIHSGNGVSHQIITELIKDGYTPEVGLLRAERDKAVQMVLDKMKPVEADMLRMFYIERLKYIQIVSKTGFLMPTVKTHLFRAKKSFKKIADEMNSKMKAPLLVL